MDTVGQPILHMGMLTEEKVSEPQPADTYLGSQCCGKCGLIASP